MPLLTVQGLRKTYAGRAVVNGVSFTVNPAEIVGLLGRNGAGKTTSFRMAIGMIDADDGRVAFDDHDVTNLPMFMRARLGMGYLSQEPSVFGRMTCRENLIAILETLPLSRADRNRRADELLAQFGLTKKSSHPARTCSGGERRKLEIARSLITDPRLILLDEPFSGVDPIAVEDLQKEIRSLTSRGIACLITDHNVQQTLRVCDRAYIIDEGKVFAEGTPRELINNDLVKRVYLGSLFRGDEFDPVPAPRPGTPPTPIYANQPATQQAVQRAAASTPAVRPVPLGKGGTSADFYTPPAGAPAQPAKPRVTLLPTTTPGQPGAPTITINRPKSPPPAAPPPPPGPSQP